MAKLILTSEVSGLGSAGDVVEGKDGYARNYLLPRGFATRWTSGAQKQIDQMAAARRKREIASIEDARTVRDNLEATPVTIDVRAGKNGRLFGAVTAATIAEAVKEQLGADVDRRKVHVSNPIKSAGEYKVTAKLYEEVEATINVVVNAVEA